MTFLFLQTSESTADGGPSCQQDNDNAIRMDVSGDLNDTPCQDERPSRSSTPDPQAAGRRTPAPDASPISLDRSANESFKSVREEPREFPSDQLTEEQLEANIFLAANLTTPKTKKSVKLSDTVKSSDTVKLSETVKSNDKKGENKKVDFSKLSKNAKARRRQKLRKARALENGRISKPTANPRTPVKQRLQLNQQAPAKHNATPHPNRTPMKSHHTPRGEPSTKGPRTPTKPASKQNLVSGHPQDKKVHPAVQARGEPNPQVARLRGVIKSKEALIRKKDDLINELGKKQIARCSLLMADCKPGKLVERLHAADNQIKKRPFTNSGEWISQHNEACNLLMSGKPAEWMSTCGSSALPENFFCPLDSMSNTTKLMVEKVPERFRHVLVAASSLLTMQYISHLDLIAPPPLPILKVSNLMTQKVVRPSLGTVQKIMQID